MKNTLKANGEGGDKRVTQDSLNNMPFATFKRIKTTRQNDTFLIQNVVGKSRSSNLLHKMALGALYRWLSKPDLDRLLNMPSFGEGCVIPNTVPCREPEKDSSFTFVKQLTRLHFCQARPNDSGSL